jgi:hypothetical protein
MVGKSVVDKLGRRFGYAHPKARSELLQRPHVLAGQGNEDAMDHGRANGAA